MGLNQGRKPARRRGQVLPAGVLFARVWRLPRCGPAGVSELARVIVRGRPGRLQLRAGDGQARDAAVGLVRRPALG